MTAATRTASTGTAVAAVALAVGAALLWGTFHTTRGGAAFWVVGFLLAGVWIAGARALGPFPAGRVDAASLAAGAAAGVVAFVPFYAAYRLLREVPVFAGALDNVVVTAGSAHLGALLALTLMNGVAEELFFRGALTRLAGDPRRAVVVTTVVYGLVTAASLNVALVVAATVMGALWGVMRQRAGGVVVPALCHVTWSTLMLLAIQ